MISLDKRDYCRQNLIIIHQFEVPIGDDFGNGKGVTGNSRHALSHSSIQRFCFNTYFHALQVGLVYIYNIYHLINKINGNILV